MRAELPIEPSVHAVAPARRWARATCAEAGLDTGALDVLVLLVSETVTNAVLHAHPPVTLCIDVDDVRTRVEVHDGDGQRPILRDPPPTSTNGRGVLVIDRLATRWGTDLVPMPDASGNGQAHPVKSVWFELAHRDAAADPADRSRRA